MSGGGEVAGPKVWFDMDGVLADFEGRYRELFHESWKQGPPYANKWGNVASAPGFWEGISPMEDTIELMGEVRRAGRLGGIVTALPKADPDGVRAGKALWLGKFVPWSSEHPILFSNGDGGLRKHEVVRPFEPRGILVDDRAKNAGAWEAAGGHAILHRGALSTGAALSVLGVGLRRFRLAPSRYRHYKGGDYVRLGEGLLLQLNGRVVMRGLEGQATESVGWCRHTETEEVHAVERADLSGMVRLAGSEPVTLYKDAVSGSLWARPSGMFHGREEDEGRKRFVRLAEEE